MGSGRTTRCARQASWQAPWQVAQHVAWVVEPHVVLLIHLADGRRCELSYPEAAVWDLATRRRSEETLCSMVELVAEISSQEAETLVDSCLARWLAAGWLTDGRLETGAPE